MVYIWVRATANWESEPDVLAQLSPGLRRRVDTWNETFTIPFHEFRRRLREIARLSLAAVEGARCAAWDEIPDGALVLPVDDDDWFAPDAAAELERAAAPDAAGYVWEARFVEVPTTLGHRLHTIRRRLIPPWPPRWTCSTNNYAMVKRGDRRLLLASHREASGWFDAHPGDVRRLDRPLSVMNRTLASQTHLAARGPQDARAHLLRRLRRYRTLYDRPPPPELAWTRPYLARMSELMAELRVRGG